MCLKKAFCLCDGWDLATAIFMRGMGMMIPNTLLLNQNTKANSFMLENVPEFNNVLCSYFFKEEVANAPKFVAVNICLYLSKKLN